MEENKPDISKPYPAASSGEAITRFFKKYATFSGRASRSEYWKAWFWLRFLAPIALFLIDISVLHAGQIKPLYSIWTLVTFIPDLALNFRRLHDSNLNAAWILVPPFVAFAGFFTAAIGLAIASDNMGYKEIPSDTDKFGEVFKAAANGTVMWAGIGIFLFSGILGLWLYCRKSRPEGARFDK